MEDRETKAFRKLGDYLRKENLQSEPKIHKEYVFVFDVKTVDLDRVKKLLPKGYIADYNKKFEILRILKETRSAV